jgi:Putative zinc- or iron-chelating domain
VIVQIKQRSQAGQRQCGGCTLCCKLLPMQKGDDERSPEARVEMFKRGFAKPGIPSFDKPAGERCPHQRHSKGCVVYARRPLACQVWNCRWLGGADTADQSRPDRAHYFIDIMPDYITFVEGDKRANVEAVQVWVDPGFREAHRDPALRAYLARRGEEGIVGIIRFSNSDSFVLIPPAMTSDGRWIEKTDGHTMPERSFLDRVAGISTATKVKIE